MKFFQLLASSLLNWNDVKTRRMCLSAVGSICKRLFLISPSSHAWLSAIFFLRRLWLLSAYRHLTSNERMPRLIDRDRFPLLVRQDARNICVFCPIPAQQCQESKWETCNQHNSRTFALSFRWTYRSTNRVISSDCFTSFIHCSLSSSLSFCSTSEKRCWNS